MNSLQDLLCKKDKTLSLLEESATKARQSVQALTRAGKDPEAVSSAEDVLFLRIAERKISDEIHNELHSTSVAATHSEELEKVSQALYKIPKIAAKFRERFAASPDFVRGVDFGGQLSLVDEASEVVLQMTKLLQQRLDLQEARALYERLQGLEQKGDERMLTLYRDLFNGKYPAEQIIVLKDLYELLEKLIDRTKRAGRLIFVVIRSNC